MPEIMLQNDSVMIYGGDLLLSHEDGKIFFSNQTHSHKENLFILHLD